MKKPKKYLLICVLPLLVIIIFLLFFNSKKNISVHHAFENGIIVKDDTILDNSIKIELNGIISKNNFILKKLAFCKDLKETLTINGINYNLSATSFDHHTHNLFWGGAHEKEGNSYPDFVVFISDDLNLIYLCQDKDKYHIAAPAQTMEDYNKVKHCMLN